jgi:hypothetical protein
MKAVEGEKTKAVEKAEKAGRRVGGGMQVKAGRRIRNRLQINDINGGYLCCRLRWKPGRGRDHGRGCCRGSMPEPTKNFGSSFIDIISNINYEKHRGGLP